MPARQVLCAVTVAFVSLATPRQGDARSVPVSARLDYVVAAGCPGVDAFEEIVAGRLGYSAFRDDAQDSIVVRIEPAGRTLKGRIEWRQASGGSLGEQQFPSRTGNCAELTRAMGFALAVQIQLMAATIPEPPPPPVVEAPPPPPPPPASAATTTATATPPEDHESQPHPAGRALLVGVGASAGVGMATGTTALGRLFGTIAWPHFALELGADASLPSTTYRASGAGFSEKQFAGGLAACGVLGAWSACAVGRAGAIRVSGTGVDVPLTATGLTMQAGARLAAALGLGHRAFLIGRMEGLARLTQRTVLVDSTPAWTTPRLAAIFGLDLALRF